MSSKKSNYKGGGGSNAKLTDDSRFSSMHTAPIFKKSKKDNQKVKVDDRFKSVLTDDRFRVTPGGVDKYGRKTNSKTREAAAEKELSEFYTIDNEEENDDDDDDDDDDDENDDDNSDSEDHNNEKTNKPKGEKEEKVNIETRLEYLNRLARGDVSDSSSSNENSDDESDDSGNIITSILLKYIF
jgi:hypothetical protein